MEPESPPAPPPTLEEARAWVGCAVEDEAGAKLGQARGLFADEGNDAPTWLVVRFGRRGGREVTVPVRDCAAGAGHVWVAHPKRAVQTAPVVDPARVLLREHELAICAHFGIGADVGRAAEVTAQPEGSVTSRPV